MKAVKDKINIISVTPENVAETGVYCIKDRKAPGYRSKVEWLKKKSNAGLNIKIAANAENKPLGFIEYLPSESAWRPIQAENHYFVQCMVFFVKAAKGRGIGSYLLEICEKDAEDHDKSGVCAMSSDGPWIANKAIFEKNGYELADRLGRFELMHKKLKAEAEKPKFIDWTQEQAKYQGWNLIYSDQCPWHEKAIQALSDSAEAHGIELKIKKLTNPREAQTAPSGFGTFSLIHNGKLLADHYISRTRFETILKKEMAGK